MSTYEKVRTKDGRVMILKNPVEVDFMGAPALTGIRCNSEGETGRMKDGVEVEIRELVSMDMVGWRKPMVMSNHYGELVYL